MAEVKYVPVPCEDSEMFEGHVVIKKISMMEKMDAGKSYNNIDSADFEKMKELILWAKSHVIAVDIKNKIEGSEFKSFDDLLNDGETDEIVADVAMAILIGPTKKKMMNGKAKEGI
jgi:hypothetical protein